MPCECDRCASDAHSIRFALDAHWNRITCERALSSIQQCVQFNPSIDTLLTPTSVQFVINERDIIVVKISRMREQCIPGLHFPPPQNTKAWDEAIISGANGHNALLTLIGGVNGHNTLLTPISGPNGHNTLLMPISGANGHKHTIDSDRWWQRPLTHYWHQPVYTSWERLCPHSQIPLDHRPILP